MGPRACGAGREGVRGIQRSPHSHTWPLGRSEGPHCTARRAAQRECRVPARPRRPFGSAVGPAPPHLHSHLHRNGCRAPTLRTGAPCCGSRRGWHAMVGAPCRPVWCGCSIYRRTEQSRSNRWMQLPCASARTWTSIWRPCPHTVAPQPTLCAHSTGRLSADAPRRTGHCVIVHAARPA